METAGQSIPLYNALKELENLVAQALQQLPSPSITAFDIAGLGLGTVNSTIIELQQFLKINETKEKIFKMNEMRKWQSEEKAAKPTQQCAVPQSHSSHEPLQSTLRTGFVVISVYVNASQRNLVNFYCSLLT